MSQMLFSHDTELTLRAACGLINSDRVDGEQLGDMAALDAFLDGWGWTGRRDHDAAELASIHRLRERLGKIWARRRRRGSGRRPGQRAAQRHQGVAVADAARRAAGVASASGVGARPALAADGRGDGDGAGRPDPRRGAAPAEDLRGAGLRGRRWWTCRATARESSATPATAATVSTSRPTASGARMDANRLILSKFGCRHRQSRCPRISLLSELNRSDARHSPNHCGVSTNPVGAQRLPPLTPSTAGASSPGRSGGRSPSF